MYRAELVTRHYEFEAYDKTETAAVAAVKEGLLIHFRQCGAVDPEHAVRSLLGDSDDDICVYPIRMGVGYRDKEELKEKTND